MSKDSGIPSPTPEVEAAGVSTQESRAEGESPGNPEVNDTATLEDQLEAARAEIGEHQERSLRLAAELENVRRRFARELDSVRRHGLEHFAADLLPVIDSLELALAAAAAAPESLREGLEMTIRLLHDILSRHHIEPIDPMGEPFDPNVHEAMATQPSSEPADTVLQVVQKGYRLHGRLLRPARVIVSRPGDA